MSLDAMRVAARSGRPGAEQALVKALYARLRGFFRRYGSPADAEDLVQATLLVLYRRMDDFEPTRSDGFEAMVFATANRMLATKRRSRARERARRVDSPAPAIAADTSPSNRLARRELFDRIQTAYAELRSTDRRMLAEWAWSRDWRELIEAEGVARATLRSRVFRALARLREAFRRANPALLPESSAT
ncbi:RNA polymerase sigma factor [Nannocystaceae bacterium ST9]